MSHGPDGIREQAGISYEVSDIEFAPVDMLSHAEEMVDALDALAEMNRAWGQHTIQNNSVAKASFMRSYKEDKARGEEILRTAMPRYLAARERARGHFAAAYGFPSFDEANPLPERSRHEIDYQFTSFKNAYARTKGSAPRRDSYRERLVRSINTQRQTRVAMHHQLPAGLVEASNDILQ